MNLRHSLSLTVSSVTLILKVLLYTTVLFLIAFALFMAITEPIIESFGSEFDMIAELQEDFSAMLQRGDNGPLQNFISSNSDELVRTVILYILLFLLIRFGVAFSLIPTAFVLYNKMSTGFNQGFINATVATGGKAALYALTYTAITVPMDLIILIIGYYFVGFLVGTIGTVGLAIGTLCTMALAAFRLSLTAGWAPEMIAENLKFSVSVKRFFANFNWNYVKEIYPSILMMFITVRGIVATTAVPTIGIIPIFVLPCCFVWYTAISAVGYFNCKKRKYYIDERVIDPNDRF